MSPIERHCDTCLCGDSSSVNAFDLRCSRLLEKILSTLPLSDEVRTRTRSAGTFAFGFTGWKMSAGSNTIAAQFLVALYPRGWSEAEHQVGKRAGARFFYCGPASLWSDAPPVVGEYQPGDSFVLATNLPTLEEFGDVHGWEDERLSAYLRRAVMALVDLVEKVAAEWTEPMVAAQQT